MKKFIIAALAVAPFAASAQQLSGIQTLLTSVGHLINLALPIVVALALLAFFWGLVKFIFAGEEGKKEGRSLMIWGIVALFVMVSIWGLVRFIGDQLGIYQQGGSISVPTVNNLQ